MSILRNTLVKKYFGCESVSAKNNYHDWHVCGEVTALCILKAMEEPIKKGDRYLFHRQIPDMFGETHFEGEEILNVKGFHPFALRLPSQFQESREKCDSDKLLCEKCRRDCKCTSRGHEEKPDPGEEKIDAIVGANENEFNVVSWSKKSLKIKLNELVELARRAK